jgi:hypothetical protein
MTPIVLINTMLKARLHTPSVRSSGTSGLCLLVPNMTPAAEVFAGQNSIVSSRIHNTFPETSAK